MHTHYIHFIIASICYILGVNINSYHRETYEKTSKYLNPQNSNIILLIEIRIEM